MSKDLISNKCHIVYLKSVSRGLILSIILLLIATMIFFFTELNEDYLSAVIWIITILSVCYAAIHGTIKIGRRGYLHGGAIGAIYVIVIFIIGFLSEKGQVNMKTYLITLIMSIIIGGLSGMIGMIINNK